MVKEAQKIYSNTMMKSGGISVAQHKWAASITKHLTPNLFRVLQECNGKCMVSEQAREKQISFASCRNAMASAWTLNRLAKNNLFGPPSSRSNPRPYETRGKFCFC
jgi:hypothetical protein